MSPQSAADLPRRLLDAVQRGDLDALRDLYADDVQVWNNIARTPLNRDAALTLHRLFYSRVRDLRFDILDLHEFPGGAVDRHVLRCATLRGEPVEAHVAIVWAFRDGKITRLFEYLDQASLAKVFA